MESLLPIESGDLPTFYKSCQDLVDHVTFFTEGIEALRDPLRVRDPVLEPQMALIGRRTSQLAKKLAASFDSFPRTIYRRFFYRSVNAIDEQIDGFIHRWGWSFILAEDGEEQIESRYTDYLNNRKTPLLRQALAWRIKLGIKPDAKADSLADEAENCYLPEAELEPGTTADMAERRTWELHEEWLASTTLGEVHPVYDKGEYDTWMDVYKEFKRDANWTL